MEAQLLEAKPPSPRLRRRPSHSRKLRFIPRKLFFYLTERTLRAQGYVLEHASFRIELFLKLLKQRKVRRMRAGCQEEGDGQQSEEGREEGSGGTGPLAEFPALP